MKSSLTIQSDFFFIFREIFTGSDYLNTTVFVLKNSQLFILRPSGKPTKLFYCLCSKSCYNIVKEFLRFLIIKPFQIRQQMMLFILSSTQWQTGEGSVLGMGSVFDFKGNASCREKLFTMKAILTGSYKFANVKKNVGKLSFFFFQTTCLSRKTGS